MKRVFTIVALTFGAMHAQAAEDCAALLVQHQAHDLQMSYEQFDQTEGQGMRVLAQAGCEREAEQLLLEYIQAHPPGTSSLWWHAAQMAAGAGDYAAAAEHAKKALVDPGKLKNDPLLWNEYVEASIAYFDRDKPRMKRLRDEIERRSAGFWGNEMNLNLLDAMLAHFDEGYDVAGKEAMLTWKARSKAASAAKP